MEINFTTERFNKIFDYAKIRMIDEIRMAMGNKNKIMFKVSMKGKATFETCGSVCMLSVSAENEKTDGVLAVFIDSAGKVCYVPLNEFTIEDIFTLGELIENYGMILDN